MLKFNWVDGTTDRTSSLAFYADSKGDKPDGLINSCKNKSKFNLKGKNVRLCAAFARN